MYICMCVCGCVCTIAKLPVMGCSNNSSKYEDNEYNNNYGKSLMSSSFINEETGVLAAQIPIRRKQHATRATDVVPAGMKPSGDDDENADEQKDPDLFEGDPRPLPYAFEKELIGNSNKHIRICEVFVVPNQVYPITSKFYAKCEQNLTSAAPVQRLRYNKLNPDYPLLESQVYGWIPLQSQETAAYLNCIHAPKRRCRMTIHGEHIIAGRITERPPFNGLKFIIH